jgi:hypothetical protein
MLWLSKVLLQPDHMGHVLDDCRRDHHALELTLLFAAEEIGVRSIPDLVLGWTGDGDMDPDMKNAIKVACVYYDAEGTTFRVIDLPDGSRIFQELEIVCHVPHYRTIKVCTKNSVV